MHRPVLRQAVDLLGDQVVVLGRLQRDVDARDLAQLAGPHAGAVDDVLGFDVAVVGCTPVTAPLRRHDAGDRHAFDDGRALQSRALGQRHGDVDRVGAAVLFDVEAGEHVVGAGQREELAPPPSPRSRARRPRSSD